MKFLTLSEREIKSTLYNQIKEKHIVISISGSMDNETVIPPNINRVSQLFLKFDDIEDISEEYRYFDRSQAQEIIDFVEKFCNQVSLIVVQCQAGLSRSVAVASALSKIINYSDDYIFSTGIPNMFVYTTILDTFFSNPVWQAEYSRICNQRNQAMLRTLTPAMVKLYAAKEKKRIKEC